MKPSISFIKTIAAGGPLQKGYERQNVAFEKALALPCVKSVLSVCYFKQMSEVSFLHKYPKTKAC